MILTQLIYTSFAEDYVKTKDVEAILDASSAYNEENHVTGVLLFDRLRFVQVLEGERGIVSKLYNKILLDGRHKDVTIIGFSSINERHFGHWTMGYITETALVQSVMLKYSATNHFVPELFNYEQLRNLLYELSKLKLEIS